MSDNKFIKHLRGEDTAKSVLEIKNQRTTTSFANMPDGDTSNANDVYSDHRGDAVGVLKGTENWKLDGQNLVETTTVYGDGRDFSNSTYEASGNGLWVDASCTFATARRFSPNTKFVLKLCGHDLVTVINHTVDFTLIVKFGVSNLISKTFTVTEQAFNFCKEFVIDFAESNLSAIKADAGSTMQIQLLCADANARAVIYNGMTVFTALQRRVDGDAVASDKKTFDEVVQDIDDINDEIDQIHEDIDDLEEYVDDTFVKKAGDTMTGALNIANIASSNTPLLTLTHSSTATYKWNIAPRYNSTTLSVYPGSTETNGFRFATTGFVPASNNARYLGSASLKWKGVYTGALNNGADLVVPNKAGTLATMGDVELAARSGTQLTDQGVWYAKMYAATVAPAAEDGTNYADFSQVDGQGNQIIVTYNRVNGAWVQDQTITPPAEYDGYVIVTSKIWDIAEQTGQQGGHILWNHQSKEFTPYPQIISFEDINVTGNSTVDMPQNPGANQIVNKDYVDEAIASIPIPTVNNPTITITQGGVTKGSFTLNQASDDTIALDAGGGSVAGQSIDAEIVGGVVVNGSEVSNLGTGGGRGHLILPGSFNLDTTTFEVGVAFTTSNQSGNIGVIKGVCTNDGSVKYPTGVSIGMTSVGNFIAVVYTDINDPLAPTIMISGGTAVSSTKYYLKLVYDQNDASTPYKLSVSTDGTTYTVIGQSSTNVPPSNPTQYTIGKTGEKLTSVDMSGCYIKRNGIIIWQGMDAPGLPQRAAKGHEVIEFQAPTAGNNYTWYRKYADGWVEQGGTAVVPANSYSTISFPIVMQNTEYQVYTGNSTSDYSYASGVKIWTKTQTSMNIENNGSGYANTTYWQVSGMSA